MCPFTWPLLSPFFFKIGFGLEEAEGGLSEYLELSLGLDTPLDCAWLIDGFGDELGGGTGSFRPPLNRSVDEGAFRGTRGTE